jgi:hypothetical protein
MMIEFTAVKKNLKAASTEVFLLEKIDQGNDGCMLYTLIPLWNSDGTPLPRLIEKFLDEFPVDELISGRKGKLFFSRKTYCESVIKVSDLDRRQLRRFIVRHCRYLLTKIHKKKHMFIASPAAPSRNASFYRLHGGDIAIALSQLKKLIWLLKRFM